MRILFVDDETRVLDNLREILQSLEKDWTPSFASSGKQGLTQLQDEAFDAVVCDLRMPDMDGDAFLAAVGQTQPQATRILLAYISELEAAMRSSTSAHEFLTKPCRPRALQHIVERSCKINARLHDAGLQRALGKLDTLPVLPSIYTQLTRALADPDVHVDEIAEIVNQDTGMTFKILQLVNSSFFGIPRRVDNMRDAISFLGLGTVKTLTLSYGVFHEFDASKAARGFSLQREHDHAMQVANMARRLLPNPLDSDQAFLAGVLHDIGKLVVATNWHEKYEQIHSLEERADRGFHQLERRALEIPHAEIGAYLLGRWGLPFPIVAAVQWHHSPLDVHDSGKLDPIAAVHIADALVHEVHDPEGTTRLDLDLARELELTEDLPRLRELAQSVVAESRLATT